MQYNIGGGQIQKQSRVWRNLCMGEVHAHTFIHTWYLHTYIHTYIHTYMYTLHIGGFEESKNQRAAPRPDDTDRPPTSQL